MFPGLRGGPLMHVIAAKAVAFGEALRPEFKTYAKATIANAQALADRLKARGADVVAGGTDTHLALIDLRPLGITGRDADEALERSAITCNKNGIPFDPLPPVKTSGIRVGSPAGTTRGFGIAEFEEIGDMVADVLEALRDKGEAWRRRCRGRRSRTRSCAVRTLPHLSRIRTMARQHPEEPTLVELSIEEVKAMGKQGMAHPSTRPGTDRRCDRRGRWWYCCRLSHWPVGLFAGRGDRALHEGETLTHALSLLRP